MGEGGKIQVKNSARVELGQNAQAKFTEFLKAGNATSGDGLVLGESAEVWLSQVQNGSVRYLNSAASSKLHLEGSRLDVLALNESQSSTGIQLAELSMNGGSAFYTTGSWTSQP